MRCLPPLDVGPFRWALPMADASAAALAEFLATGKGDGLVDALRSDPPLLIWTVHHLRRRGIWPADSVENVARWLADHALEVLHWPSPADASFAHVQASADVWAGRVAAAVELAELAAQLAGENRADRDAAFYGGLLHYAADWLQCDTARLSDSFSSLSELNLRVPRLACPTVPSALLAKPAVAPDAGKASVRAAAAADRWRQDIAGPADWLPQLAERMARLAALEKSFAETLEEEKLAALAEFAAGAGHEINNPLTVIAGRAQLFLREEAEPERRRGLALINAQAMRVYEMIADLRLFARPPRAELQPVDVSGLIDRVIAELSPAAASANILMSREAASEGLVVAADPTQLLVALRALCENAIQAIGARGRVMIVSSRSPGGVEIRVSDDGPGISPEEREHIFDPFYSARQAGRGLGLGLSKCWRIVTNHAGRIAVKSRPGEGATFIITLPEHGHAVAPTG